MTLSECVEKNAICWISTRNAWGQRTFMLRMGEGFHTYDKERLRFAIQRGV